MGGEGSMLHAIKSMQNNRELLKKRKRRTKDAFYERNTSTPLQFKKATPEIIAQVKAAILAERRKYRRLQFLSAIIVFLVITVLL